MKRVSSVKDLGNHWNPARHEFISGEKNFEFSLGKRDHTWVALVINER